MTITECKYYRDKDKECDVWGIPCSMKKDCYYKQLKRLEQENEKLKQTLQEIKAIAETGMHCEGMGCDFMPQILDLITKAEEE